MAYSVRQGRGSSTDLGLQCPKCEVMIVPKKDHYLTCKLCEYSWHKDCIDEMDEDEYKVLKKNEKKKTKNIHWYCSRQCDRAANKFLSKMSGIEEEIGKVNKRVASLDAAVAKIKDGRFSEEMNKTVEGIVRGITDETANQVSGPKTEEIQDILEKDRKDQIEELEDRIRRKKNLIIFRLPEDETESKTAKEMKEEDNTSVDAILKETGVKAKPLDIRRLGQAHKNGKGRPLRVIFESEKDRDDVLFSAIRVSKEKKDGDNRLCTQVSVRKDLTKHERDEETKLFIELKKRREEAKVSGDDKANWVRRRGKVINIGKYPENKETSQQQDSSIPTEKEVWG